MCGCGPSANKASRDVFKTAFCPSPLVLLCTYFYDIDTVVVFLSNCFQTSQHRYSEYTPFRAIVNLIFVLFSNVEESRPFAHTCCTIELSYRSPKWCIMSAQVMKELCTSTSWTPEYMYPALADVLYKYQSCLFIHGVCVFSVNLGAARLLLKKCVLYSTS